MAQEKNIPVWSPDGSKTEKQTIANARDMVLHAGWSYTDPKAVRPAEIAPAETNDESDSFDEAEKAKADEDAKAKAAAEPKSKDKPSKKGKK